jgi:hypothetical protein
MRHGKWSADEEVLAQAVRRADPEVMAAMRELARQPQEIRRPFCQVADCMMSVLIGLLQLRKQKELWVEMMGELQTLLDPE